MLWDWRAEQYVLADAEKDAGYDVYSKPAERVVASFYGGRPE